MFQPYMEWAFLSLGVLILSGIVFLIVRHLSGGSDSANLRKEIENLSAEKIRLDSQVKQYGKDLGKLSEQLDQEKSSKDKLTGQIEQISKENFDLKAKIKSLEDVRNDLNDKVVGYEKDKKNLEERVARQIDQLNKAERGFEDEKIRVRGEDEERQKRMIEERDRLWNEHQNIVGAKLRELCQRPEISFNVYDSTNLPKSFDGSLKPDYLVELFPEQYIIFDAKFTENKISTYFATQVPATVQKIKQSSSKDIIYPTIFFVVPVDLLQGARKLSAFESGFSFFMISPESLAPILACYKKITEYQFADQLDPQERENIVNVISVYETFIRNQNAVNVLLAKKAIDVVNMRDNLSRELNNQIDLKRMDVKTPKLKDSDIKRLSQSDEMGRHIQDLTSPKADLKKTELEEAEKVLL